MKISEEKHPIFIQSYSWKKDDDSPYRMGMIFLYELDEKPHITLCDELEDYGWFNYEDIKNLKP